MPTPLPHGRLILNGHRLHTITELEAYITRRLGLQEPFSYDQIDTIVTQHHIQKVAIRHADTFLIDEPAPIRHHVLTLLSPYMKK